MKMNPILRHSLLCLFALACALSAGKASSQDTPPEEAAAPQAPVLVGTFPLPDQLFDRQIVFYFDQELAPAADPSTLIAIEPPVAGTWEQGSNYVALSMDGQARPAPGVYRATFQPALTNTSGQTPVPPEGPMLFANAGLDLKSVSFGTIGLVSSNIQLSFSLPVSWEQLQQHLSVTDATGAAVEYNSPRREASTQFYVAIPSTVAAPLSVVLSPGLSDASGRFQTKEEVKNSLGAPKPFALSRFKWDREDDTTERFEVALSHAVPFDSFAAHFQLFPDNATEPLAVTRGRSRDTNVIAFEFERPLEPYKILRYAFTPGIEELPALIPQTAQTGTATIERPELRIEYHNWDAQGIKPLRLQLYFSSTVAPDALEKHLTVTPAVAELKVSAGEYGGIDIEGEWESGKNYRLNITEGLSDQQSDQVTAKPISWSTGEAPNRSGVAFAFEEPYYFPRRQAGPLTLYARNVEKADLTLYQLFPSNLVRALDDMQSGKSPGSFGYDLGRKIAEKSVTFENKKDARVEVAVPMDGLMPEGMKGIFGLSLSPGYDYYNTKVLVWTDIGVLAHWQSDQLLVYAHNLWNLAPIPNANVTLYSAKHQVMGEARTDESGVARMARWDEELGRPRAIIVESEDDFTFLPLNERSEDPVTYNDAMPDYNADGYDAFLYLDRNLYRPGEPLHIRWLVRKADGSPLTDAPLNLRVIDPNENVKEFTTPLSAWGSGSNDLETERAWLTGVYRIELWVPGATLPLTTQTINLEDFVPQRIAVTAEAAAPLWLPGEEHAVTVNALQLSGGPASERKASAAVILEKKPWKPEQWPAYTFTNDVPFTADVRELGETSTDGLGNASYVFRWMPPAGTSFPVEATIRGEVFEPGGRSVAGRTKAFLFPAPDMLGLAVATSAATNSVDVSVLATHPDGTPSTLDSAKVTLERRSWRYYVRRYSNTNESNWSEGFETVKTVNVSLKEGQGSVKLDFPADYGTYRVKVHRDDSPQFATQSFWSYGGRAQIADDSRPSLIKLVPDKKSYLLGESATVRIESPFDGNAIVVLQGTDIEKVITVPITNGAGVLTLPLEARHVPNIWLEATVIHPVEPGAPLAYPYASFAMLNLPVADPSKALSINFASLPEVIRPMSTLDVTLTVAGTDGIPTASEVTLALVDEGIHQILQYQSPDPVAWFQRARRPEFRRAHYYDQVAYDFQAAKIGGDELLRKRLGEDDATIGDNWIKPLALWSGTVETDATGTATISMKIPEFSGKVRLVAVATTGDRAGSNSANVTIRRPVILRTSLPRYVAPGDTFSATVVLQNMMDTPVSAVFKASADAPLTMEAVEKPMEIAPGAESLFTLPLSAGELTGSGLIHWSVTALNAQGEVVDEYVTETPLKVQSPSVYQVRGDTVVIAPGDRREFANTEFKENALLKRTFTATPNPLARLRKALDYVVGYPYGCVEQTTSRCLPLFLLGQAASNAGNDLDADQFQQYLQAGIDRLLSMQTRSGGLGYWPGAREPNPYGSVYAAHFLTLARQDGALVVPDEPYESLMRYVTERIPLTPSDGPSSLYRYAYACYVRALSKDTTVMEDINSLDALMVPTAARQWLALAAITFTGARDRAQEYLLNNPSAPYDAREQGDVLNSEPRNDAITLMTQMAVGVDAAVIQRQAEKLLRYLEQHQYSTQEAAFVVTALSAYLQNIAGDASAAHASILTPEGTSEHQGEFQFKHVQEGPGGGYAITNSGNTPLYVYFATEGILVNPDVEAAANGITLTRTISSKEGVADLASLKQGENYLLTLEITCDESFENVILADLLPGGLEIENPRLDSGALASWKKTDGIIPSFLEMRDDRLIAAFDSLKRGTHKFYYAVRAVTPGTFHHPGANAECMYEVKFNGRTAAGSVTIVP